MGDPAASRADVDQWLNQQHSSLIEHLAVTLDLEAGLRDTTLPSRHAALIQDLRKTLDLETGLAAVIDHDATLDLPEATEMREQIRSLASERPSDRLDFRTHTDWPDRLTRACACIEVSRRVVDLTSAQLLIIRRIVHAAGGDADEVEEVNALSVAGPLVDDLVTRLDSAIREPDKAFYLQVNGFRDSVREIILALGATRALWRLRDLVQDLAEDLDVLESVLNDFTGADIQDVDLHTVNLTGLRWSNDTRWPEGWAERIRQVSVEVGSGVFVIRGEDRHDIGPDPI